MPETIALHTELRPGRELDYERIHAQIPAELNTALRDAGVRGWRIWRDGTHLFHLVEVDDCAAMRAALADHPVNVAWQAQMDELLAVPDDYSGQDSGLPLVWRLP